MIFIFLLRISACVPELSNVVVACLSVCGADHTHAVAGPNVAEFQQHHRQVVDEQLGVHQGHGKLNDTGVILILVSPHRKFHSKQHIYSFLKTF